MIRKSLLLFFLLLSISSFAQNTNQNLEWRALNYFLNEEYDEAIEECNAILKNHSNDLVANRTRLILARALMQSGDYHKAISILQKTQLDAEFFSPGIQGMIGDCKSEQGKYKEARQYYLKAINNKVSESLTPYYLFKAYLCSKRLNQPIEANKYIQTILDYFPNYTGKYQVEKYLMIDSLQSIELNQREISQPPILGIGTVNGTSVSESSYYEAIRIARMNSIEQAQQTGNIPNDIDEDRVWDSFTSETALTREYERLNLFTDEEEMMAYLMATDGYSVQIEFINYPAFTNDNGDFLATKLLARIDEMRHSQEPEQREAWENTAVYYKRKLRQEKYFNLIGLIPFTTSVEVDAKIAESVKYKVNYYCERFRDIDAESISISEDELKSYYEKNKTKPKYRTVNDERHVLYLREEILPTKADTLLALSDINDLLEEFKETKDDSSFVIAHSALPFFTSGPYSTAVPENHEEARTGRYLTYPNSVAEEMLNAEIGDIVGPYEYADGLNIAKVIGRTDEVINARHILLVTREGSEGNSLESAQEIFNKVSNENFEEYVKKYSEDFGSVDDGGYLGDFFFGDMVPSFATYCADAPIGQIGFVQSQFGYHIVQVTKRSGLRFPRLAVVAMPVELSEASYTIPQNLLKEFRQEFLSRPSTIDLISAANNIAESLGTFARVSRIVDDAPQTYISNNQLIKDSLFQFTYDPDQAVGSVSPIYEDSTASYLFVLASINKKGVPAFDYARDRMYSDLILDRKSELLTERLASYTQKKINDRMWTGEVSLANTTLTFCGFEPNVIGKTINAYHAGKKSLISRGISGIFYTEVVEELPNTEVSNREELRETLYLSNKAFIVDSAPRALDNINQIVDNRTFKRLKIRP